MNLLERDSAAVWHPFTPQLSEIELLPVVRAESEFLITEDGRRIIDGISSWWVNIHGHAHPEISKKISEQLAKLHQVIFAGCTHEPAVQLAENLLQILPGDFTKIFYSDNGSTAVEVGLKMAIQYWSNQGKRKGKIIALENGYHGDTFGCMSVSGSGLFTAPFESYLFSVERLPLPVDGASTKRTLEMARSLVKDGDCSAFIYEPLLQGAAGMLPYERGALEELLKIMRDSGTLLIADEVMTGFGRTAKLFASEYLGIKPDIIALSKGITGGSFPLGVTACSKTIHQAFLSSEKSKTFFHGHSYTANPLACSAAIASLEILLRKSSQQRIAAIAQAQSNFISELALLPQVKRAAALGTISRFELNTAEDSTYLHPIRDRLYREFLARGVLLRPLGNVVYFMPPYCISNDSLRQVYDAVREVVAQFPAP